MRSQGNDSADPAGGAHSEAECDLMVARFLSRGAADSEPGMSVIGLDGSLAATARGLDKRRASGPTVVSR